MKPKHFLPFSTSKIRVLAALTLFLLPASIQTSAQSSAIASDKPAPRDFQLIKLSRLKDGSYCHNVVVSEFKGELYAQWQCSERDEDAADTRIFYSKSRDGRRWSRPCLLPLSISGVRFLANGGWWQSADSLTCFVNITDQDGGKSCMYVRSADGRKWTQPRPVLAISGEGSTSVASPIQGIMEQDLRALPDGRILTAFHMGANMICTPFYTDDPSALSGWKAGEMEHLPFEGKPTSREIEPSWYIVPGDPENTIVMIFRDQASSYKKIESVSRDRGETWSAPVLTGIEDSRSKQSAGNLPDGRAFMVWNPSNSKDRWLYIGFGMNKEDAYVLRLRISHIS